MRVFKAGIILIPWLLSAAPASAQPYDDYGEGNYDAAPPGEAVASVDVFYDQLSPYGYWVDEPAIGHVYIPDRPNFVPYHVGHWQYTNLGFVWVSNEPFAWATFHYGRWAFSTVFGRWVWLPDTTWGPAWVEWRESGDHFGWAPLAPEFVIQIGYEPPIESWHYCHASHILDVDIVRYYEPRERIITIHREARSFEHVRTIGNARVVVGPPPTVLRAHNVVARPVKVDVHVAGRFTAVEAKAAVTRAEQRKPVIEEQNRKRVEANVTIRESQKKAATMPKTAPQKPVQPPARVEPKPAPQPAQPGRVEPKPAQPQPPARVEPKPAQPPNRVEPKPAQPPNRVEPKPAQPPNRVEPKPAQPQPPARVEPKPAQPPARVEPKPEPKREAPARPEPPARVEPKPEPKREVPAPKREAPPAKKEPPKKDEKQ